MYLKNLDEQKNQETIKYLKNCINNKHKDIDLSEIRVVFYMILHNYLKKLYEDPPYYINENFSLLSNDLSCYIYKQLNSFIEYQYTCLKKKLVNMNQSDVNLKKFLNDDQFYFISYLKKYVSCKKYLRNSILQKCIIKRVNDMSYKWFTDSYFLASCFKSIKLKKDMIIETLECDNVKEIYGITLDEDHKKFIIQFSKFVNFMKEMYFTAKHFYEEGKEVDMDQVKTNGLKFKLLVLECEKCFEKLEFESNKKLYLLYSNILGKLENLTSYFISITSCDIDSKYFNQHEEWTFLSEDAYLIE
ncbi:hypothetical protein HERIO_1226 [Hepatospora eriocheir]|uniref:Uncharacterized protein n=1 Tax=Hepatospora eriocheir TaxID=1081669 RepID=A0A1X0QAY3_9MICR|nr:hypothetical protein HERIO_1226 [Hepatospora eriocheir]